jgi:hypothetical protein
MANLDKGGKDDGPTVRYVPTRVITKTGGPGRLTVQEYDSQEKAKKGKSVR